MSCTVVRNEGVIMITVHGMCYRSLETVQMVVYIYQIDL